MNMIAVLKDQLKNRFQMKDLGPAKRIMGMEIVRDRKRRLMCLHQSHYLKKILDKFEMKEAKHVSTPLANHHKLQVKVLSLKKIRHTWIECLILTQLEA